MNLNELITFKKAAELLNFSNTAKELNYSQSAITIQIKNLEEEFGVQLFDRIGKHIKLTPAGKDLLHHANKIINDIKDAKLEVGKNNKSVNTLRVGCIDSICSCHIPNILKKLSEDNQIFPLKITTSSASKLFELMEKNQIDIVYTLDKPIFNNKWIKAMDQVEDLNFITSSDSKYIDRKDLSIRDIINENFYLTEIDDNYRLYLRESLAELNQQIYPKLEVSNTDVIIKSIINNKGISFLPNFAFKNELDKGLISILPIKEVKLTMNRQIFYHKDKFVSNEMKRFIEIATSI